MPDPIDALPTPPSRSDTPATFISRANAFIAALVNFVTQTNAVATAMNLNATSGTSATSNSIGTGAKTFTANTNKSWLPGMFIVIADTDAPSTNSMLAQITSYNSGTGELVVDVKSTLGSGTKTAWTISQTANPVPLNNSVATASLQDDAVTNDKLAFDGGALSGFRNKIIGGDFTLNPWQRGTSFTSPTGGAYTADRWTWNNSSGAVVNVLKAADAPTADEAWIFTQHCLHVDVTTADAAVAAGDVANVTQNIEGYNIAPFGFGQSGARYVTLSFWVKSSKTGVHCVSLRNSANDRSCVKEYTVDVADTWEKKTITFPVDTSGTWLYDNGIGLRMSFTLMAGSTLQTTADTWQAGNFFATANQVNLMDSTANNFKLDLVQLEAGETATSFEERSRGEEQFLCQRYYIASDYSVAKSLYADVINRPLWWDISLPVSMRATPTITGGFSDSINATGGTFSYKSPNMIFAFVNSGATGGFAATCSISSISAEL